MKFKILCENDKIYYYDNMTSEIFDENNNKLKLKKTKQYTEKPSPSFSKENPLIGKSYSPYVIKIQLGFSCNQSCTYCSQRFVPNGDYANVKRVETFLHGLDNWLSADAPKQFAFWGGEPFVYWKMMKPLAEGLRKRYPKAKFFTTTNGTLLTKEIVDWLDKIGMYITLSHDGPGQKHRGYDVLEENGEVITYLFEKLGATNRVGFYTVMHSDNKDRGAIQKWFEEKCAHLLSPNFKMDSTFLRVYSDESKILASMTDEEHKECRFNTMNQIMNGKIDRFKCTHNLINEWVESFENERPAEILGQSCSMDKKEVLTVDLYGNVLTCQNTTIEAVAENGESHKIGHLSKLDKVSLSTSSHWSVREECVKCPVLQTCRGSCMYLQNEYFKTTCDLAYTHHIPHMAVAFKKITGYTPINIQAMDNSLPENRQDLWGLKNERL